MSNVFFFLSLVFFSALFALFFAGHKKAHYSSFADTTEGRGRNMETDTRAAIASGGETDRHTETHAAKTSGGRGPKSRWEGGEMEGQEKDARTPTEVMKIEVTSRRRLQVWKETCQEGTEEAKQGEGKRREEISLGNLQQVGAQGGSEQKLMGGEKRVQARAGGKGVEDVSIMPHELSGGLNGSVDEHGEGAGGYRGAAAASVEHGGRSGAGAGRGGGRNNEHEMMFERGQTRLSQFPIRGWRSLTLSEAEREDDSGTNSQTLIDKDRGYGRNTDRGSSSDGEYVRNGEADAIGTYSGIERNNARHTYQEKDRDRDLMTTVAVVGVGLSDTYMHTAGTRGRRVESVEGVGGQEAFTYQPSSSDSSSSAYSSLFHSSELSC